MSPISKLVVVGGNGFIGSAICRLALARGLQVTSISTSGRPYQTPKGHTPAWTTQVDWQKGDALRPETFASHLDGASGVVHTLGMLLQDAEYKRAIRDGDVPALLNALIGGRNPLEQPSLTYESMNRDSALSVCEAFVNSKPPAENSVRPLVFISAEDVFRPWVSARYIETKREAERGITALLEPHPTRFRGVYLRPGLVYHAHLRPITTPAAALLDLTASVHSQLPGGLRSQVRSLIANLPRVSQETPSSLVSVANALTTRPLHVDHVAGSAVKACLDGDIRGVVGVKDMRELMGWAEPESSLA
ncbi:adenylate kinase [Mycena indigotica]|uniref:Adenylate kinase n=1 Tax=Mycena indigotica TaxID=2126181 RepID=A0A8H6VUZ0_9AGAR|nr:adenylate kinase [Mycena indigotica]KAF7294884.1 adenylate kinase [Mycena indigotica]